MLLVLGCGYVGEKFLLFRKEKKEEYIASTTSVDKLKQLHQLASQAYVLKIEEGNELQTILEKIEVLVIFIGGGPSDGSLYMQTALQVKNSLKHRNRPLYLLYTSSTFVYQGSENEWMDETQDLSPTAQKAKNLLETEKIYQSCQSPNINVAILRLGGIYGPKRELDLRARHLSARVLGGKKADPTNHIHVEDLVRACWFCIDHQLQGIWNVVSDDHPTREDLYTKLCEKQGLPLPIWNEAIVSEHGCGCKISNQKLKKAGFQFLHPRI